MRRARTRRGRSARRAAGGFTLLEVMVAITVLALVAMFVLTLLENSVRGRDMVREGLRAPKIQNAILGQIFKDFRYLYWGGFTGDTGFFGKHNSVGGMDASSVDFVTARPSRTAQREERREDAVASPLTEVGYALRTNEENGEYLELWRREDWFVDDNPVRGGKYTRIYDRITTFNLLYFPIPEENLDGKGVPEWDSRVKKKLPYAIVLDIRFDVDSAVLTDDRPDDDDERIRRIIVLKSAYNVGQQQAPGQGQPGTPSPPAPGR